MSYQYGYPQVPVRTDQRTPNAAVVAIAWICAVLTLLYMLPWAIAATRGKSNQAMIGVDIARVTNSINLAGWLPQANVSGNLTHYNSLPTSFVKNAGGTVVQQRTGVVNTFNPVLSVTQTIFNPALLYASRSADLYVHQAEQITDSTKIQCGIAVFWQVPLREVMAVVLLTRLWDMKVQGSRPDAR